MGDTVLWHGTALLSSKSPCSEGSNTHAMAYRIANNPRTVVFALAFIKHEFRFGEVYITRLQFLKKKNNILRRSAPWHVCVALLKISFWPTPTYLPLLLL